MCWKSWKFYFFTFSTIELKKKKIQIKRKLLKEAWWISIWLHLIWIYRASMGRLGWSVVWLSASKLTPSAQWKVFNSASAKARLSTKTTKNIQKVKNDIQKFINAKIHIYRSTVGGINSRVILKIVTFRHFSWQYFKPQQFFPYSFFAQNIINTIKIKINVISQTRHFQNQPSSQHQKKNVIIKTFY